jgi:type III secretion protein Q
MERRAVLMNVHPPLRLKRVSQEQMEACNLLYRRYFLIAAMWLGRQWQWTFAHSRHPAPRRVELELDWGGARVVLRADLPWLEQVTQTLLQAGDMLALPPDLQIALAETAFAGIADRIEASSKRRLRITRLRVFGHADEAAAALEGLEGVEWNAECDGQQFDGELWMDAAGVRFAGAASRHLECIRPGWLDWELLPVRLRFVLGSTMLSSGAFATLGLRDVIVLDESWLMAQDTLTVMAGSNAGFRARLSGARLIVTEGWVSMMDESFDDGEYAAGDMLGELPVRLTFDLGERSLPFGELEAIAPGYTFDLGRDLRQAVVIRANGVVIGEGELVDIDGRTGVAVLSLSRRSE